MVTKGLILMAVDVLQSPDQYLMARAEMRANGISCVSSTVLRALRKLKVVGGVSVGDVKKSWDVLKTARFVHDHLPLDAPILDVGAFASEMLCVLERLRHTDLIGIDLNPQIEKMPRADKIRYLIGDLMDTPFDDSTFAAVTAISVIEHGFDLDRLLAEISRILCPGGFLIASVDYWPEKIDTCGLTAFGMDWRIFSRGELLDLVERAKSYELNAFGDLHLAAQTPSVEWLDRRFTFAWLVLQKPY